MRFALVALAAFAGCAARTPDVPLPSPEPRRLVARAVAASRLGDVQPIVVAVTNGREVPARIDPRQVFALDEQGARIAPLPPGEAARRSGGHVPGALKGGAVGAATGGALGALGGLISGAIQGGIGAAAAVGSAVGAAIGAITGVIGGARDGGGSRVAEFQERALPDTTLARGMSATGYVYYPRGTYPSLELLAVEVPAGTVASTRVGVE